MLPAVEGDARRPLSAAAFVEAGRSRDMVVGGEDTELMRNEISCHHWHQWRARSIDKVVSDNDHDHQATLLNFYAHSHSEVLLTSYNWPVSAWRREDPAQRSRQVCDLGPSNDAAGAPT